MKATVAIKGRRNTIQGEVFALPEGGALVYLPTLNLEGDAPFPDNTTGLYYQVEDSDEDFMCPKCRDPLPDIQRTGTRLINAKEYLSADGKVEEHEDKSWESESVSLDLNIDREPKDHELLDKAEKKYRRENPKTEAVAFGLLSVWDQED